MFVITTDGMENASYKFSSDEVKKMVAQSGKEGADLNALGMSVAFDLAGILMTNIGSCKEDIYQFLAQLSGMSKKDIAALPMATFFEMIIDVIKKEEFKDFFQVVSKLFK